MGRIFLILGSAFGFLGVAAGAFGAHGLRRTLSPELLEVFETGARYQMYHALALLAVAWLARTQPSRAVRVSGWCFVAGIVVFSGSLYILALTDVSAWGAVTPVGGTALLTGWALLSWCGISNREHRSEQ